MRNKLYELSGPISTTDRHALEAEGKAYNSSIQLKRITVLLDDIGCHAAQLNLLISHQPGL